MFSTHYTSTHSTVYCRPTHHAADVTSWSVLASGIGVGLVGGVALGMKRAQSMTAKYADEETARLAKHPKMKKKSKPVPPEIKAQGRMLALKAFGWGTVLCLVGTTALTLGTAKYLDVSNTKEFVERMRGMLGHTDQSIEGSNTGARLRGLQGRFEHSGFGRWVRSFTQEQRVQHAGDVEPSEEELSHIASSLMNSIESGEVINKQSDKDEGKTQ